jgi:hypothetical protein
MRRIGFALLGALALASVLAAATTVMADNDGRGHEGRGGEGRTILEFDTMTPVVDPFLTAEGHPIRGILGGGVPWVIQRGEGELSANGKLEVEVRGLVIASTGVNPVRQFVAAVNCLTTSSPDTGVTLLTPPVNVGANGNARFEATLNLPHPCVAPIVFVGTPAGTSLRWFATTGN